MKLLTLLASPRRKGNTSMLLDAFLEGFKNVGTDVGIDFVNLQGKDIKPCKSCGSCRKVPYMRCVINDDMQQLYRKVMESDTLVFATPVYWWNISAQLKLFIDRLYALEGETGDYKCLHGKKIVILMTYDGSNPNSGAELIVDTFKHIADYLQMEIKGVLGICSGEIPVENNKEALDKAFKLGEQVYTTCC